MRIGSLCSGYGGLDESVRQVLGGHTVWVSDVDKGANKILAHRYPGVPNLGDMTTVDWAAVEPVDVLTAGYPCQPFSHAGRRKGTNDERHLWPYVRQAVRVLRPRLTLLENVAGHRSLGFDRVLGDLAEDGMHVRWTSVRASDVGACHQRERLFIVVTPPDSDDGAPDRERPRPESGRGSPTPAAADLGHERPRLARDGRTGPEDGHLGSVGLLPTPTARDWKNAGDPEKTAARMADRGQPLTEIVVNLLPTPSSMNAANDPGSIESWTARRDRELAKGINGNQQCVAALRLMLAMEAAA